MIHELIGYASMVCLLLGLAFRKRKYIGSIFNLIGSPTMIYYCWGQIPVVTLNVVWTIVGTIQLIRELTARQDMGRDLNIGKMINKIHMGREVLARGLAALIWLLFILYAYELFSTPFSMIFPMVFAWAILIMFFCVLVLSYAVYNLIIQW